MLVTSISWMIQNIKQTALALHNQHRFKLFTPLKKENHSSNVKKKKKKKWKRKIEINKYENVHMEEKIEKKNYIEQQENMHTVNGVHSKHG